MLNINKTDFSRRRDPGRASDRIAQRAARTLGACADALLSRRYGNRAIVLETVTAVPPMALATLLHLRCLRKMIDDRGWVRTFMDEAENQRAHLMSFVTLARPSAGERFLILLAQGIFYNGCFLLCLISPRTAHRFTAYLAEESIRAYSDHLAGLAADPASNGPAPPVAISYWGLPADAKLSDMIAAMREDEAIQRDVHHAFADALADGLELPATTGPLL